MNISANVTYVASYLTTSGFYSFTSQYFAAEYDNAPLRALADGASGGNGLFQVNGAPIFPTQNFQAGNFWVDVVFASVVTPPPSDTTPPVVSAISVTNITSAGGTVNWTTDEQANGQVEIVSPCSTSPCLTSLVSALTTSHAITLSGLNANTLYTYRILSKDAANNLGQSSNQTFTTAAAGPPTTPPNPPSNLVATCNSATQVTLSWSAVPTASSYLIRVKDQGTPSSAPLDYADEVVVTTFPAIVQSGHQYAWWVHGVNSAGVGRSAVSTLTCP